MKRRAVKLRLAAPAVVACVFLANSCYRAEIDLALLQDRPGGGTSAASGAGAGGDGGVSAASGTGAGGEGGVAAAPGTSVGGGGSPATAGASGADAGADSGGSGGSPEPACDDTWTYDAEDFACRQLGYPTNAECAEQDPQGWSGCYHGGCTVCTVDGILPGFPYYFKWHRCCQPNDVCSNNSRVACNARCPPPTEHDRVRPCDGN